MSDAEKLTPYGAVEFGEMCPTCGNEEICLVDYEEHLKILKGETGASLPLIHCSECGSRLAPCSLCTDAINDGIITEEERKCDACPIERYWADKFGQYQNGEDKHGEDDMTEEKKTPSIEEIQHSFYEKCHCNYDNGYYVSDCTPCDYCKILYGDYSASEHYQNGKWTPGCVGSSCSQEECINHYIYEVATGQRDINKPLWNPPKVKLPEWFKDGVFVFDEELNRHLKVIDYETRDDNVVYATLLAADGEAHQSGAISYEKMRNGAIYKPVKFRPYESIEELEALLGKKLRFKREAMGGGSTAVETITSVEYDSFDGSMNINLRPYSFYTKEVSSTIDGLPIGVPVVDEEALEGVEK